MWPFDKKAKRIEFAELPEDVRDRIEAAGIPGVPPAEAMNLFRQVAADHPGYVPGRLNLACLLLESGAVSEARAAYEAVARDWPDEPGAAAGLATVLSAEGSHTEAERLALDAVRHYSWPPLFGVIARAREHRGDQSGAAAAYLEGYETSPHCWNYLDAYCRLADHPFTPPTDDVPESITATQLRSLIEFIDCRANEPDASGGIPGCDHTLRLTKLWAAEQGVELISLYQYLNGHGGFCDCEVCMNVSEILDEPPAERDA